LKPEQKAGFKPRQKTERKEKKTWSSRQESNPVLRMRVRVIIAVFSHKSVPKNEKFFLLCPCVSIFKHILTISSCSFSDQIFHLPENSHFTKFVMARSKSAPFYPWPSEKQENGIKIPELDGLKIPEIEGCCRFGFTYALSCCSRFTLIKLERCKNGQ